MRRYGFQDDDIEVQDSGEKATPAKSEFAEGDRPFTPYQQAVEDLADAVIPAATNGIKGNEELFVTIIEKSESFEEAMEKLLEAWPQLNMDDLAASLERAMLNAELFGRWTVDAQPEMPLGQNENV